MTYNTVTTAALDIGTGAWTTAFTATEQCRVSIQYILTGLTNTAATISVLLEHLDASDNHIADRDWAAFTKRTETFTADGGRPLNSILLANGEKLRLYIKSSNASDTNVTCVFTPVKVNVVKENLDKTGYDLVDAPNATALNAITSNILNNIIMQKIYSANCGKIIRTINNDNIQFDFYDDAGENIIHSFIYSDDNTREVI